MAMEANNNRRIRLNFKDPTILTKTQKKQGLKRSWFLLKPHHHTIYDVVSDIIFEFNLLNSSPHDVNLSMDGFALPPFESTTIFKDKDLVSVKRKKLGLKSITEGGPFIEDEIVEKRPLASVVRLLASEELDKEIEGYKTGINGNEVETEELVASDGGGGVASKKRKASSPIEISKKKKLRQVSPESVAKKDINQCENIESPQKKRDNVGGSKTEVIEKSTNNSEPNSESNELDEKEMTENTSNVPNGAKKAKRSSRRRKLQRQWRKLKAIKNNEEGEKKSIDGYIERSIGEESDGDDDIVPVEIRPGHIRFTSARKAKDMQKGQDTNGWDVHLTEKSVWGEHSSQKNVWDSDKNKVEKETFCWNGITSKKKGQKWGKDNQTSWKESGENNGESSNSRAFGTRPTQNSRRKSAKDSSIDFEKLLPLIDSPKVGDVVAYRLLELSSSWCPELSSFRVGKITSFDQETNKTVLVQEAEYPLNLKKNAENDQVNEDESGQPSQPSVYNEDGSLEIDFPSLVDVRIVKKATPSHLEVPPPNATSSLEMSRSSDSKVEDPSKNGPTQELHTPTTNPGNNKKDVWEEISEALSAKKAELSKEDTWNKKESSSSKRSWSHRTLKSSALGPTMAMLRSQNGV